MMQTRTPEILFANANLVTSPLYAWRPPEWLGDFVDEAGYDGVEWHPILYSPAAVGAASEHCRLHVKSLHQSFRTGPVSQGVNKPESSERTSLRDRVKDVAGRLIMPELVQSAHDMHDVQERLGKRLPVVLYPQADVGQDRRARQLAAGSESIFQPTDHVAKLVGAATLKDLDRIMFEDRRYTGYCLDTVHAQRRYGKDQAGPVSDIDQSLNTILARTTELHVSLNRQDVVGDEPHIETEQDLRRILKGSFAGPLKEMLDEAKAVGKVERVVVELTTSGLAAVTKHRSRRGLVEDYRTVNYALREYFNLGYR